MTHNPDGSVTLTAEEAREIAALLSIADRRVRDIRVYTNSDATSFARAWATSRAPELTTR